MVNNHAQPAPAPPAPLAFMSTATATRAVAALADHSPHDWADYSNLASAFFVLERDREALSHARYAVKLERNPFTLLNLGMMLEVRSRFEEAMPLAEEAFSLSPADPIAACWYSDSLLRAGKFHKAWPIYSSSHADWSWFSQVLPEWNGHSDLQGKRLLVLSGGGYGDNILFLRWMPFLKALGAHITFMCPPSFSPLLAGLSYIDRTINGSVAGLDGTLVPSDYDLFTCILALGEYFCPEPGDIPPAPYLTADVARAAQRRYVLRAGAAPLFGICTRAGEEKFPRRHRSLSLEQTSRILATPTRMGANWVNLNFDTSIHTTLQPAMRDWADTAAIISCLDLVVTVDTGVAHLAGAMNIPCFVILPGISAAYYGLTGDSNLFYPSQRLFRNSAQGLDNSISAACDALATWRPHVSIH